MAMLLRLTKDCGEYSGIQTKTPPSRKVRAASATAVKFSLFIGCGCLICGRFCNVFGRLIIDIIGELELIKDVE